MIATDVYVVVHQPISPDHTYVAAFAIDESNELLEAVDFADDGTPEWESAGICDQRGDDPALQTMIGIVLERLRATVPEEVR